MVDVTWDTGESGHDNQLTNSHLNNQLTICRVPIKKKKDNYQSTNSGAAFAQLSNS